jgi:hypothetical protein
VVAAAKVRLPLVSPLRVTRGPLVVRSVYAVHDNVLDRKIF